MAFPNRGDVQPELELVIGRTVLKDILVDIRF